MHLIRAEGFHSATEGCVVGDEGPASWTGITETKCEGELKSELRGKCINAREEYLGGIGGGIGVVGLGVACDV